MRPCDQTDPARNGQAISALGVHALSCPTSWLQVLCLAHLALTVVSQGKLTPCPAGFLPPNCTSKCQAGTFGLSCASVCPSTCQDKLCMPDSGFCLKCRVGFRGLKCADKCKPGYFGQDCSSMCPVNCWEQRCDPFSGNCEKCQVGFAGAQCNHSPSFSNLAQKNSEVKPSAQQTADQDESDGGNFWLYAVIILIAFSLPACVVSFSIFVIKRKLRERAALNVKTSGERPIYRGQFNSEDHDHGPHKSFPRGLSSRDKDNESPGGSRPRTDVAELESDDPVNTMQRQRTADADLSPGKPTASLPEFGDEQPNTRHHHRAVRELGQSVSLQSRSEKLGKQPLKRFTSDSSVKKMTHSSLFDDEMDTPRLKKILKKNTPLRLSHAANYSRDLFFKTPTSASSAKPSVPYSKVKRRREDRDNQSWNIPSTPRRRSEVKDNMVVLDIQNLPSDAGSTVSHTESDHLSRASPAQSGSKPCRTTPSDATATAPQDIFIICDPVSESTSRSKNSWKNLMKLIKSPDSERDITKAKSSDGHSLKIHRTVSDSERPSQHIGKGQWSGWRQMDSSPHISGGQEQEGLAQETSKSTGFNAPALDEVTSGVYRETTRPLTPPALARETSKHTSLERLRGALDPSRALHFALHAFGVLKKSHPERAVSDNSPTRRDPKGTSISFVKSEPSCSAWNESELVNMGVSMDVNNAGCRNGNHGDNSEQEGQTNVVIGPGTGVAKSRYGDGVAGHQLVDVGYAGGISEMLRPHPIVGVTDPMDDPSLSSEGCVFKTILVDSSSCLLEHGRARDRDAPGPSMNTALHTEAHAPVYRQTEANCDASDVVARRNVVQTTAGVVMYLDRFRNSSPIKENLPEKTVKKDGFVQTNKDGNESVSEKHVLRANLGDVGQQEKKSHVYHVRERASDYGCVEKTNQIIKKHAGGSGYTDGTTRVMQITAGNIEYQDNPQHMFHSLQGQSSPRSRSEIPRTLRDPLSPCRMERTTDQDHHVQQVHVTVRSPGSDRRSDLPSTDNTGNNKSPLPVVPPGAAQGSGVPKTFYPQAGQGMRHSRGSDHRAALPPWTLFPTHPYPGLVPIPLYNIKNMRRRVAHFRLRHAPNDIFLKIALAVPKSTCNRAHFLFNNAQAYQSHLAHNKPNKLNYPVQFDQLDTDMMTLSPPKSHTQLLSGQKSVEGIHKSSELKIGNSGRLVPVSESSGASTIRSMIASCLGGKKTHTDSETRRSASLTMMLDGKTRRDCADHKPKRCPSQKQNRESPEYYENQPSPQCMYLWETVAFQNENTVERTSLHDQRRPPEDNAIKLTVKRIRQSEKQYELVSKDDSHAPVPLPEHHALEHIYQKSRLNGQRHGNRHCLPWKNTTPLQMFRTEADLSEKKSEHSGSGTEDDDNSSVAIIQTESVIENVVPAQSLSQMVTQTTTVSGEAPRSWKRKKNEKSMSLRLETGRKKPSEMSSQRVTGVDAGSSRSNSSSSTENSDGVEVTVTLVTDSPRMNRSIEKSKEITISKQDRKQRNQGDFTEGSTAEPQEEETACDSKYGPHNEKKDGAHPSQNKSPQSDMTKRKCLSATQSELLSESASQSKDELTTTHHDPSQNLSKSHKVEVKPSSQGQSYSQATWSLGTSQSPDEDQVQGEREPSALRCSQGGRAVEDSKTGEDVSRVAENKDLPQAKAGPKVRPGRLSSGELESNVKGNRSDKRPPTAQRLDRDRRQTAGQKMLNKHVEKAKEAATTREDSCVLSQTARPLPESLHGSSSAEETSAEKVGSQGNNAARERSQDLSSGNTETRDEPSAHASRSDQKPELSWPSKQVSRSPVLPTVAEVTEDSRCENKTERDVEVPNFESGSDGLDLKTSIHSATESSHESPLHMSACLDISFKKWDCVARTVAYPLPSLLEIFSRGDQPNNDSRGIPLEGIADQDQVVCGKVSVDVLEEEEDQVNYLSFGKEDSQDLTRRWSSSTSGPRLRGSSGGYEQARSSAEYQLSDYNYELDATAVIFPQSAFSSRQPGNVDNGEFQSIAEEESECFYDALETLGSSKTLMKTPSAGKGRRQSQQLDKKGRRTSLSADTKYSGSRTGVSQQAGDLRLVFNFKEMGTHGTSAKTGKKCQRAGTSQGGNRKGKKEPQIALRFAKPNDPKQKARSVSVRGMTGKQRQESNTSTNRKGGRKKSFENKSPAAVRPGGQWPEGGAQSPRSAEDSRICESQSGSFFTVGEGVVHLSSFRLPSPSKLSTGSQSCSSSKDDVFCSIEDTSYQPAPHLSSL